MRAEERLFLLGGADLLHGRGIDGDAAAMRAATGGAFDIAFRRAAVGGRRVKVRLWDGGRAAAEVAAKLDAAGGINVHDVKDAAIALALLFGGGTLFLEACGGFSFLLLDILQDELDRAAAAGADFRAVTDGVAAFGALNQSHIVFPPVDDRTIIGCFGRRSQEEGLRVTLLVNLNC